MKCHLLTFFFLIYLVPKFRMNFSSTAGRLTVPWTGGWAICDTEALFTLSSSPRYIEVKLADVYFIKDRLPIKYFLPKLMWEETEVLVKTSDILNLSSGEET